MPIIATISDGVRVVYALPPHIGDVTVTANSTPATIASQDSQQVTLAAPAAFGQEVAITYSNGRESTNTTLLKDQGGVSIQALAPGASANVSIGIASARVAIPAGSQIVRVASNCRAYFAFGDSSVTASGTNVMFPSGAELFAVPPGATHIAVIQDGAVTGAMNITRMV